MLITWQMELLLLFFAWSDCFDMEGQDIILNGAQFETFKTQNVKLLLARFFCSIWGVGSMEDKIWCYLELSAKVKNKYHVKWDNYASSVIKNLPIQENPS